MQKPEIKPKAKPVAVVEIPKSTIVLQKIDPSDMFGMTRGATGEHFARAHTGAHDTAY